jgi:hypothetical protein
MATVFIETSERTSLLLNIFAFSCCKSLIAECEDFLHGRQILLGQWSHQLYVPINVLLLDAAQNSLENLQKICTIAKIIGNVNLLLNCQQGIFRSPGVIFLDCAK